METPSRVATLASHLGVAGLLALVVGPLAIQIGALSPFMGFRLFLLGGLCGLLALVLGLIGLWRTRATTGREGRGRALRGALLGAAILALIAGAAGSARGLPAINDITTNPDDPPAFAHAGQLPGNEGRDLSYPSRLRREAARGLSESRVRSGSRRACPMPSSSACARRSRSAGRSPTATRRAARWRRPRPRASSASSTTSACGCEPTASATVVDVRSKSRVGRGDMGANAKRIEAFRKKLTPAAA